MRFIFGYVTCCLTSTPCNDDPSSTCHGKPLRVEEETRSLVTAKIGRRRKRSSTRGSSGDWQPSLFVIKEDNNVLVAEKVLEKVEQKVVKVKVAKAQQVKRNAKRCRGVDSGRDNTHSRSYDFSCDPGSMVIPAFSASPFVF